MIEGPRKAPVRIKRPDGDALRHLKELMRGVAARLWHGVAPARREADPFLWNLRLVSRFLWVVLAGFGVYVIVELVLVQSTPRPMLAFAPSPEETTGTVVSTGEAKTLLQPVSEYLAAVTERNPFTGRAGGLGQPAIQQQTTARDRLEELASGLVVVGIDRGPNPMALVEDTDQQRTYFLKVGDEINGVRIKKISAAGVVISYEGEERLLP